MQHIQIGASLARLEDDRLLRGLGRYTDDFRFSNQAHLFVLRSPHPVAAIKSIVIERALELPGVLAILTGRDAQAEGLGTFPSRVQRHLPDGRPHFHPPYGTLSIDKVRYVGDAIAAVIAESLSIAREAADLVEVEYEPGEPVIHDRQKAFLRAPAVWDEAPENICFIYELGNKEAVAKAFQSAAHISKVKLDISRVSASPMEPRNAIGLYDGGSQRYTLYTGTQEPHTLRAELAEFVLKIPETQLRVISPDCGGSFGMKMGIQPEYPLVLWAAKKVGRPVRWQSDRSEAFVSDHHSRDNISSAELALDNTGHFLALRVQTTADLGAYVNSYGLHSPTNNLGGLAGPYRTPAIFAQVVGIFSNTNPTAPYRGAGRPEASYVIERLIDIAAKEIGIDRVELRRRNMISPTAMPFKTGLVYTYDSGEFERCMDIAVELSAWSSFESRRTEATKRGRLRGIGLASVVEIAGGPLSRPAEEYAELRFDRQGYVTVFAGTHPQGQGHETTFTQVVSQLLGMPSERIRLVFGDTDLIPHGQGSFGSRTASVVTTALMRAADRIVEKGSIIAAHLLETAISDIEFALGHFKVVGTDRSVEISEVAKAAFRLDKLPPELEPGLTAATTLVPKAPTFPNACHVCEIEIEPDTGVVTIVGYWVVDDVGLSLNPLLIKGQIHGGVVQGIGQALFENIVFEPGSGQLLTGTFLDYCMPRADDVPSIEIQAHDVPATVNPMGIKGVGECGTVGALPAVMNAINHALGLLGIRHLDMPATSERIWRAIASSQ